MTEDRFKAEIKRLQSLIDVLPDEEKDRLTKILEETIVRHKEIKESIQTMNGWVDDLRLSVKYLVFDLEATKRERDMLKKKLSRNNKPTDETNDDK